MRAKPLLIAIAMTVLSLSGCATGYGKSSLFGGYWNREGPGELVEVGFDGNGYIRAEKVELYLLFRSAEIAQERNKPYFSMYAAIYTAILDQPLTEASATSLGGKPYGKVFLLLHEQPVAGALSTSDIISRYGPQVRNARAAAAQAEAGK